MQGREVRHALHTGRLVYSTCITTPSPRAPEIMRQAKLDFVFIDTEHTPIGRETLSWMCQSFAANGVPPVVRVPSADPYEATKVIDGGASGVIAPYVESLDQVRAMVGAVRWRPLKGRRLEQALKEPDSLDPELRKYIEARNADHILILNIESGPAIENLEALLAIPGVDAVLLGPHDLSCSLGIPEKYSHPRFEEAVLTMFRKARSCGVGAGFHFWDDIQREIEWIRAGANLVVHSADIRFIKQQLTHDLEQIRSAQRKEHTLANDPKAATV